MDLVLALSIQVAPKRATGHMALVVCVYRATGLNAFKELWHFVQLGS